jgi:hypothetical protein
MGRLVSLVLLAACTTAAADDVLDVQGHSVIVGPQTQIIVDDQILPAGSPVPNKPGMRVEVTYASGAIAAIPAAGPAAAAAVVFSYAVRGPITGIAPLRVFGQEVGVNADTRSTGLPGGSFNNLVTGQSLDVSGYVDTNSSLAASFVEFLPVPPQRWLLSGYVSALGPGTLASLGSQQVDLAGVTLVACGAALSVGQFVEIRATAVPAFDANSVLQTITSLRCVTPVPIGTPGALGALSGIIGQVFSPTSFQFGPYLIATDASTTYRFGSADDVITGAAIEVDGTFGANLQFAALGIQFTAPMIRLEGPVSPADVQPGAAGSVLLLGNSVRRSAQLRDQDNIYLNGISQNRQIELRGYLDHLGNRFATRARLRGAPDLTGVRIGGPVEMVARPMMTVLANILDTTGATFEDPAALPITADAFFAQALPGASVEQLGSYDVATQTLSGGIVALIAALDPPPPATARSLIVGTLLSTDLIFAAGFE